MDNSKLTSKKHNWFPQALSPNLLGIFIAILSGIVINLLTSDLPQNNYLIIIYFISLSLFILSALATIKILSIRMSIDLELSKKRNENEEAPADDKAEDEKLWDKTLSNLQVGLRDKFLGWKFTGILSLLIGLILMLLVNVINRSLSINQDNTMHEKSVIIGDSITSIQKEISIQNKVIIQVIDSLEVVKKELKSLNKKNVKREKL